MLRRLLSKLLFGQQLQIISFRRLHVHRRRHATRR